MEIELKRIAYDPRLDERSFAGSLYINGEKAATVSRKNDNTKYLPVDEKGMDLVSQVEEYRKKQPIEKKIVDGKEQSVRPTLADQIDALFAIYLEGIEQKKFNRKVDLIQKRNIVVGESGRYMRTIPTNAQVGILVKGNNKEVIKDILVKKVIPSMSEKEVILNTNIPGAILNESGLKPEQYLNKEPEQVVKKPVKKSSGMKP